MTDRQTAIVEAHARGDRETVARLAAEMRADTEHKPTTTKTDHAPSLEEEARAAMIARISNAWTE